MSVTVVVDTNILVRATLSGKGLTDAVLEKIGTGDMTLVYSQNQLEELLEVLGYDRIGKKYKVNRDIVEEVLNWISKFGREIGAEEVELCRDPDDNHVVGLAVKAAKKNRAYLISGDHDILVLKKKIKGVKILTAGEFIKNF